VSEGDISFLKRELNVLSSEQQLALRRELIAGLAPENKYGEASLQVQFKQVLTDLAITIPLPESEIEQIRGASGSELFQTYAVGGAGKGVGLSALVRVYGTQRGPGPARVLRERMQRLAEENVMRGSQPDG